MPRRKSQGQNLIIYAPVNINKRSRSRSFSSVFAPTNSRSRSVSTESTYAPSAIVSRANVNKGSYDYSPFYYQDTYSDYAPLNYTSQSFIRKFAPSFDYVYVYRYAPSTDDELYYEPKLFSRFKPQPIIVSNSDTLYAYFNYIIQLLRVLR